MNIKNLLYEGLEMTLHLISENLVLEKGKQEWAIWKLGFTMDLRRLHVCINFTDLLWEGK